MSRARILLAAGLAALVMVGAGCSRKSDAAAPGQGEPAARVVATADFGATPLLDQRVAPGNSVMDDLRSVTAVETAYGGGFVASMLGRGTETSPNADWFFYVDGVESPQGAASVTLQDGDVAWWDHHHWMDTAGFRGVVGSWPEPFAHVAPKVQADAPLAATLTAVGAHVVATPQPFRVLVGSDQSLSARDATWRAIGGDPAGAHLAGGIAHGQVLLIPPDGGALVPVDGAASVAVLVPVGTTARDGALLAVAGTTDQAAHAAARTIAAHPDVLVDRFAVAFDQHGVPIRAAGRDAP